MTTDGHPGITATSHRAPLTGWRRWRVIVLETLLDRADDLTQTLWADDDGRRRTSLALVLIFFASCLIGGLVVLGNLGREDQAAKAASMHTAEPASTPTIVPDGLTFTMDAAQLRAVDPAEARVVNAAIPFTTEPVPPARPYLARLDTPNYARALDCLAAAIHYEAANETPAGQAAVAQTVLNRVRHPVYPDTVCGVVFQGAQRATGCQFTFTCDGALAIPPRPEAWARARHVAGAALNGAVAAEVGWSTHYHADYVVPYWAVRLAKVRQIGAHIFYRWPGGGGWPTAFRDRGRGVEPTVAALAGLASLSREPDAPPSVEILLPPPEAAVAAPALTVALPAALPLASDLRVEQDIAPPAPELPPVRPSAPPPPAPVADPASSRVSAAVPARTSRLAVPRGW